MTEVWAVVPTQGRPVFQDCLKAAVDQCDQVVVVANGGFRMEETPGVTVVGYDGPVNIQAWWNAGLGKVPSGAHALVINDDCVLGPGAVDRLRDAAEHMEAEIVFPYYGGRFAGWCWLRSAGSTLMADEDFVWWCGDNDIHRRARLALPVTGVDVEHRHPDELTNASPDLVRQAGLDVAHFRAKWGTNPY